MYRLLTLLVLTALAAASGFELHQRQLAQGLLLVEDPLAAAHLEHLAGRTDEARLLAEFAIDAADGDDRRESAAALAATIDDGDTLENRMWRFAAGAVTGEPRDLAGFLGSLSLDLFVVGDVRDIAVQGYREMTDGNGDMLILALSGVGLATTLSPHLDFAPALLKLFRRAGAISERFVKTLSKVSREAVRTGDYSRLGKITVDFGRATRALGPAPMARVMKHVDEPAELTHVSRLAGRDPAAVYALTRLSNGRAVKVFSRTADPGALAKAATRGSRLGKIVAKSLRSIPDWALTLVFAITVFVSLRLLGGMLPGRGRRSHRLRRSTSRDLPVLVDVARRPASPPPLTSHS